MRARILLNGKGSYVGDIVSYSILCDGFSIDLRNVKKMHWSYLVHYSVGDGIDMTDGTRINALTESGCRLTGYITIKVASLNEEMRFDLQAISALDYPVE